MKEKNVFIVPILDCLGYQNKIPKTGWVKQQKFIFSLFWRLEVQDPDVSRADF